MLSDSMGWPLPSLSTSACHDVRASLLSKRASYPGRHGVVLLRSTCALPRLQFEVSRLTHVLRPTDRTEICGASDAIFRGEDNRHQVPIPTTLVLRLARCTLALVHRLLSFDSSFQLDSEVARRMCHIATCCFWIVSDLSLGRHGNLRNPPPAPATHSPITRCLPPPKEHHKRRPLQEFHKSHWYCSASFSSCFAFPLRPPYLGIHRWLAPPAFPVFDDQHHCWHSPSPNLPAAPEELR